VELEGVASPFKKKKARKISEWKPGLLTTEGQKDSQRPLIHSALRNFDCKPETDTPGPRTTSLLEKKKVIDT